MDNLELVSWTKSLQIPRLVGTYNLDLPNNNIPQMSDWTQYQAQGILCQMYADQINTNAFGELSVVLPEAFPNYYLGDIGQSFLNLSGHTTWYTETQAQPGSLNTITFQFLDASGPIANQLATINIVALGW